jgi:hypothetical protein
MTDNALAPKPLNALVTAYQRYIGQPVAQVLGGGLRGYFGLDMPEYANDLGREMYRQAQALSNMPGVGAPAGAVKAAIQSAPEMAMFIGSLSRIFDRASNAKAIKLEKAGVSPRAIWEETGNWRGPDGNWRQEISDLTAEFRTNFDAAYPSQANKYSAAGLEGPVGGMFWHKDLYAAYPDLLTKERMTLQKRPDWMGKAGESGSYRPGRIEVASKTEKGAKSKALHELQHAIQNRENWQRGGSESMFGGGEDAFQKYLRLSGEAEARATEARMNLTPAQRRALFPEESYDIPLNQLIIQK